METYLYQPLDPGLVTKFSQKLDQTKQAQTQKNWHVRTL